eukprot:gene5066-3653_t
MGDDELISSRIGEELSAAWPASSGAQQKSHSNSNGSKVVWRKILYENQPFEDNYVDPLLFLNELRRNSNVTPYRCSDVVKDSIAIAQNISVVVQFILMFSHVLSGNIRALTLGFLDSAIFLLALLLFVVQRNDGRNSWKGLLRQTGRQVVSLGPMLLLISPLLSNLTVSYSNDTIVAMSIIMMTVHVLVTDYRYLNGYSNYCDQSFAVNSATFAVVLMVSRIPRGFDGVALLTFGALCFSLSPIARHSIRCASFESHATFSAILALLVVVQLWFLPVIFLCLYLLLLCKSTVRGMRQNRLTVQLRLNGLTQVYCRRVVQDSSHTRRRSKNNNNDKTRRNTRFDYPWRTIRKEMLRDTGRCILETFFLRTMLTSATSKDSRPQPMASLTLPLSNPDWFPSLPTAAKPVAAPPKPIAVEDVADSIAPKSLGFLGRNSATEAKGPQPRRAVAAPTPLGSSPTRAAAPLQTAPRHVTTKSPGFTWSALAQPLWGRTTPSPAAAPRPIDYRATRGQQKQAPAPVWNVLRWTRGSGDNSERHPLSREDYLKDVSAPRPPLPISSSPPDLLDYAVQRANRSEMESKHSEGPRFPLPIDLNELPFATPLVMHQEFNGSTPATPRHTAAEPSALLFPTQSATSDIWTSNGTRPFAEEGTPSAVGTFSTAVPVASPFHTGVQHYDPSCEDGLASSLDQLRFSTTAVVEPETTLTQPALSFRMEEEDDSLDALRLLLQSVIPTAAEDGALEEATSSAASPWDNLRGCKDRLSPFSALSGPQRQGMTKKERKYDIKIVYEETNHTFLFTSKIHC